MVIEEARAHPKAVIRLAGHDQIGLRAELEPQLRRDDGNLARCCPTTPGAWPSVRRRMPWPEQS